MMLSGLPRLVGGSSFFFILFSLLSRSLGGPESIVSCMMLSSLPRLVGDLLHPLLHPFLHPLLLPLLLSSFKIPGRHSSLHVSHRLATRSLGGPESIMSCMMLSGLPRLVGGLHLLHSSSTFLFFQGVSVGRKASCLA